MEGKFLASKSTGILIVSQEFQKGQSFLAEILCHLQVQVGGLGRSKSLSMSPYEVTSTLCFARAAMPVDASRW